MADFTKLTPDAINILDEIATLLQNAELQAIDEKMLSLRYTFKNKSYKIRVNLIQYPDYCVIEIISREEKP